MVFNKNQMIFQRNSELRLKFEGVLFSGNYETSKYEAKRDTVALKKLFINSHDSLLRGFTVKKKSTLYILQGNIHS